MSCDRVTAAVFAAFALVVVGRWGVGPRVGDGNEYYAMLFNLAEFHVPYSTPPSRAFFERYRRRHLEVGLNRELWHALRVFRTPADARQDFPHFWVYSALAVPFYLALRPAGLPAGLAFTLLHLTLLGITILVVRRRLGPPAGLVLLLLVLCSPTVWYVNKAHTEFMTVAVSAAGIALVWTDAWGVGAFAFALLATQNPPFGLVAAPLAAAWLLREGWRGLGATRLAGAAGIAALVLAHPAYYLWRFGVVTPQLLNGGIGTRQPGPRELVSVLVDPDIGLLANWWLGTALLAAALVLVACGRQPRLRRRGGFLLAAAWAFVIVSYAQARTSVFVHGATIHISRYGLWYLMFFLPVGCWLWEAGRASRRLGVALALLTAFGAVATWTVWVPVPSNGERFTQPSPTAAFVYRWAPFLWDPIPEVFYQRRLPYGESPLAGFPAVSNAECTKVLVYRVRLPPAPEPIDRVGGCELAPIDGAYLATRARRCFARRPRAAWCYLNLASARRRVRLLVHPHYHLGETLPMSQPAGTRYLGSGWSGNESWGVWSERPKANLAFTLARPPGPGPGEIVLRAVPFVAGRQAEQRVVVRLNGHEIGRFTGRAYAPADFRLPFDHALLARDNTLVFVLPDAVSPGALGLGRDGRPLALGLVSLALR